MSLGIYPIPEVREAQLSLRSGVDEEPEMTAVENTGMVMAPNTAGTLG